MVESLFPLVPSLPISFIESVVTAGTLFVVSGLSVVDNHQIHQLVASRRACPALKKNNVQTHAHRHSGAQLEPAPAVFTEHTWLRGWEAATMNRKHSMKSMSSHLAKGEPQLRCIYTNESHAQKHKVGYVVTMFTIAVACLVFYS